MLAKIIEVFKDSLVMFSGMKELLKDGLALLRKGWKSLLYKLYEKLTDTSPETPPTSGDVLAVLIAVVSQLPTKKRRCVYVGSAALALVLVLVVGSVFTTSGNNSGSGSDGGTFFYREHKSYQPEFTKLDCLTCRGDGDCNTCGGYGEVERYAGAGDTVTSKCSSCYGSGNCRTCGGSGKR